MKTFDNNNENINNNNKREILRFFFSFHFFIFSFFLPPIRNSEIRQNAKQENHQNLCQLKNCTDQDYLYGYVMSSNFFFIIWLKRKSLQWQKNNEKIEKMKKNEKIVFRHTVQKIYFFSVWHSESPIYFFWAPKPAQLFGVNSRTCFIYFWTKNNKWN